MVKENLRKLRLASSKLVDKIVENMVGLEKELRHKRARCYIKKI